MENSSKENDNELNVYLLSSSLVISVKLAKFYSQALTEISGEKNYEFDNR